MCAMVSSGSRRRAQSWVIFMRVTDARGGRWKRGESYLGADTVKHRQRCVCLHAHAKRTSLLGYTLQTASRKWIKKHKHTHAYVLEKEKKKPSLPSIIQSALPGESSASISEHSGSHTDVCTHKARAAIIFFFFFYFFTHTRTQSASSRSQHL